MKFTKIRFLLFCLIVISVSILPITKPIFSKFKDIENTTYFFYSNDFVNDINANVIRSGNSFIISCDASLASKVKNSLCDILGESVRIRNYTNQTLNAIMQNYQNKIIKQEVIDNIEIFYCYDSSLERCVYFSNSKINVQIAVKDNEINIGYPLILNGY